MGDVQLPSAATALDRIQEEIFTRFGLPPGRYGKYAVDVESLFLAPELVGLDEYGLPIQLGVKLSDELQLGEGTGSRPLLHCERFNQIEFG